MRNTMLGWIEAADARLVLQNAPAAHPKTGRSSEFLALVSAAVAVVGYGMCWQLPSEALRSSVRV
jgi:hypothetical protein